MPLSEAETQARLFNPTGRDHAPALQRMVLRVAALTSEAKEGIAAA